MFSHKRVNFFSSLSSSCTTRQQFQRHRRHQQSLSITLNRFQNGLFVTDKNDYKCSQYRLLSLLSTPVRYNTKSIRYPFSTRTIATNRQSSVLPPYWYNPQFLSDVSPERKVAWLESLLSQKKNADTTSQWWDVSNGADDVSKEHVQYNANACIVDAEAFNVVIRGYADAKLPRKAEDWLIRLRNLSAIDKEENDEGNIPLSNNDKDHLYSSSFSVDNSKTSSILPLSSSHKNQVEQPQEHPVPSSEKLSPKISEVMKPTTASYNAVLKAWSTSNDSISIVRAERWFQELQHLENNNSSSNDSNNNNIRADLDSFNYLLTILSRRLGGKNLETNRQNAQRAESILMSMLKENENEKNDVVRPDTTSFNTVMHAWTHCHNNINNSNKHISDEKEWCVSERVMKLLLMMESIHRDNYQKQQTASDTPNTLKNVIPNTASYSIAIKAWGVTAAQKAAQYLKDSNRNRRVHQRYQNRWHSPNSDRTPQQHTQIDDLQQPSDGFAEVIKAESVLSYIHELHDKGDPNVSPDPTVYNTVIQSWCNITNDINVEAPHRAEGVLRKMMDFKDAGHDDIAPDTYSFNSVINAWARSAKHHPQSAKRAEWWLQKMWSLYEDEKKETSHATNHSNVSPTIRSVKPNIFTYCLVIRALIHAKEPEKAELLLMDLLALEEKGGEEYDEKLHLNNDVFTLVINSWVRYEGLARLDTAGVGYQKAKKWLHEMLKREIRMDTNSDDCSGANKSIDSSVTSSKNNNESNAINITNQISTPKELFNTVLKSMSISLDRSKSVFEAATDIFDYFDLISHHQLPDEQSYKHMLAISLKVLNTPDDKVQRDEVVTQLLERCCQDGLLSKQVVWTMMESPVYSEGWTVKECNDLANDVFFGGLDYADDVFQQQLKNWSRNIVQTQDIPHKNHFRRLKNFDVRRK